MISAEKLQSLLLASMPAQFPTKPIFRAFCDIITERLKAALQCWRPARRGLKCRGNSERGSNGQNAPLAARLGIPPLDDDGRSHPCGGRVYRSCILSKQEWARQQV